MSCSCNTNIGFKGVSHFGTSGPLVKVEKNLQFFIDWSLLSIGAWVEVQSGFPGPNGQDASALMEVDCYPNPSGWNAKQAFRGNWVHETGITYTDLDSNTHSPPAPSVTGKVNYKYGYVANTTDTNATFAAKQVSVLIGGEEAWWKELQLQSWNVPEDFFNKSTCGIWAIGGQNRVQLPAIVIEGIDGGSLVPRGLGECCHNFKLPVNLHVLTDIKCDRQNITDILLAQKDRTISLFDPDFAPLPLDCDGFLNPSGLQYPDLLDQYAWGCTRVSEAESRGFSDIHSGLYEGVVRWTMDIYPRTCN